MPRISVRGLQVSSLDIVLHIVRPLRYLSLIRMLCSFLLLNLDDNLPHSHMLPAECVSLGSIAFGVVREDDRKHSPLKATFFTIRI